MDLALLLQNQAATFHSNNVNTHHWITILRKSIKLGTAASLQSEEYAIMQTDFESGYWCPIYSSWSLLYLFPLNLNNFWSSEQFVLQFLELRICSDGIVTFMIFLQQNLPGNDFRFDGFCLALVVQKGCICTNLTHYPLQLPFYHLKGYLIL